MTSSTEITVSQLSRLIGLPDTPALIDVRNEDDSRADGRRLPGAYRRDYRTVSDWASGFHGRSVIAVCGDGLELSQGVAAFLRQEGIDLPTTVHGPQGRTVRWGPPRYHAVHRLLTNPVYAGAYVFGRTISCTRVEGGRKVITHIRDHHAGYISWEEYDRNRTIIAVNASMKGAMRWDCPGKMRKEKRRME